jgi:hypothetical protein
MSVPALIFYPIIRQRRFKPLIFNRSFDNVCSSPSFFTRSVDIGSAPHFLTDHSTMSVPAQLFKRSFDSVSSIVSPLCVFLVGLPPMEGCGSGTGPFDLIQYGTAIIPAPLSHPLLCPLPPCSALCPAPYTPLLTIVGSRVTYIYISIDLAIIGKFLSF